MLPDLWEETMDENSKRVLKKKKKKNNVKGPEQELAVRAYNRWQILTGHKQKEKKHKRGTAPFDLNFLQQRYIEYGVQHKRLYTHTKKQT